MQLFDIVAQPAFQHQQKADKDEKGQGQNFHRRVLLHKATDGASEEEHHACRNYDGWHHHPQISGDTHGSDDRIQREDEVHDDNLDNHRRKGGRHYCRTGVFGGFQLFMDFKGAFADQKETTHQQNQVPPRDAVAAQGKERFCKPHNPGDAEQQEDAGEHSQADAGGAGTGLLALGQFAAENGYKNYIVDAEHNL